MSEHPAEDVATADVYDHVAFERDLVQKWRELKIYEFNGASGKPVYSVDTPPPYVSAAHLHVGHAMSYAQAEFVVRYKRMNGYEIFYPMGFDDNGLPTERYVEQTFGVNKKTTTRGDFRQLCMDETARGAAVYEALWTSLGLSVDWRLRYSTIDPHCRKTAQKSFLDLFNKDLLYRAEEPVLWDTVYETALAQADLEVMARKGKLYDIAFSAPDGTPLVISTTRPELIPACVGLFLNPEDARYKHLLGGRAIVPLMGYDVPILPSEDVDPAFGTGLMMCCTFGDGEDVKKWREHGLETRILLTRDGRMTELAGPYAGLQVTQARSKIVEDLKAAELVLAEKTVDQNVSVGERSGQPVEFVMAPQWFIRVLDRKEEFLKRSAELDWRPAHMKVRLDHWIEGLKYDWNISRQRFYGVPFPLWYVQETGEVILADEADLPIDPVEDAPPKWAQEKYAGLTIVPESDVMDTWMTSSLSPLINMNWAESEGRLGDPSRLPMSVRVQAFEIIRTWLFYTLVKSHYHQDALPWTTVMISGWGLNEQGKKISKRDLDQYTDANGFNRYNPESVIEKYGADSLRWWAAGSRLGHDLRYNEKDVRAGRKVVIKLWNVARLAAQYLEGFDPDAPRVAVKDRALEDRWILSRLDGLVETVRDGFEGWDYAQGREAIEKFFWGGYCDNYLEIVKDRFWKPENYNETSKAAAQATLYESLRTLLGLFAPFLPFITETLWLKAYADRESAPSLHVSSFPAPDPALRDVEAEDAMAKVLEALEAWRFVRTRDKIPASQGIQSITLEAPAELLPALSANTPTVQASFRTANVAFGPGELSTNRGDLRISITFANAD